MDGKLMDNRSHSYLCYCPSAVHNFPSLGVTELQETSATYRDRVVFLFLGEFMLAKAMEKSNLHSRIALNILKVFRTNPKYIIAAFMMVILLLGAWISNLQSLC